MTVEGTPTPEVITPTTPTDPPETPPEGDPPKETNSQQWAALVRKEQGLTKQAQGLKELEASIKEREAKLGPLLEKFEEYKDNPAELLRSLGVDLPPGAPPTDEPSTVEDRMTKLEGRLEDWQSDLEKREKEIEGKAGQAQLAQMEKQYIGELQQITTKEDVAEKYEMVNALGAHATALAVQRQHWAAQGGTGTPLTPADALGMVEEYLREEYADKLSGTSYMKGKFKPGEEPPIVPPVQKPVVTDPKTLSNNSPGAPEDKPIPLTSDERWNKIVEKRFGPKPSAARAKPKKGK